MGHQWKMTIITDVRLTFQIELRTQSLKNENVTKNICAFICCVLELRRIQFGSIYFGMHGTMHI